MTDAEHINLLEKQVIRYALLASVLLEACHASASKIVCGPVHDQLCAAIAAADEFQAAEESGR